MDQFQLPEIPKHTDSGFRSVFTTIKKQKRIAEYYMRQENLLKEFNEVDTFTELGILPGVLTESQMKTMERNKRIAIYASNIANMGITYIIHSVYL